jgi:hypothetical protein
MDRFSTRLASSIVADRYREAAEARRPARWAVAGADEPWSRPASPSPASRVVQALARPFGLRAPSR